MVEERVNLDRSFVNELGSSMPARLAPVIAANGGNEFEA